MNKSYNHYFPTPASLLMHSFSFDISEECIRYGELKKTPVGFSLGRFGEQKIPVGVIVGNEIKDEEKLTNLLKHIRLRDDLYFVRVALPNTSSDTIKQYVRIFKNAGLVPLSLELGTQALANAIISHFDPKPAIIIDFGDGAITFSIVANKKIIFSKEILTPDVSEIGNAINQQYIKWKKEFGNAIKGQIEHILLCGKYGNIPLLPEYITAHMKMKTEYANVWVNISDMKVAVPNMPFQESLAYGKIIGLALGDYLPDIRPKVNVLPKAEKKIIDKEYKLRFMTEVLHLISLIGAFAILLLIPVYFISIERMNLAEHNLEMFNNSIIVE